MPKLSLVLPCYNEAENIELLLDHLSNAVKRDDIEVMLVNNGSTDNSAEVLERLIPQYSFARTSLVPVNKGYGHGILHGLRQVEGEYIGWAHADLQTDPKDVFTALDVIEREGSPQDIYLKGRRRGRPLFDTIFTDGMSLFESFYLGVPLTDINAQPNVFHRSFFESWKNPPEDFALDLYAFYLARKSGLRIVRFDVQFPPRLHGSSKWNTGMGAKIKFIKRTLAYSSALKRSIEGGAI